MSVVAHAEEKYQTGSRLRDAAEWPGLRTELWRLEPGSQHDLTPACTEIAIVLSGKCSVRRTGNGQRQEGIARPGTIWLCPADISECDIELSGTPLETLHIFVPPSLLEAGALMNYDINPSTVRLAYAGGFTDPMIMQIGFSLCALLYRGAQPTDRLLIDGMQAALAARLLANYTIDQWQTPACGPAFDPKRLKRVLDFVEARLSADISLEDLAAEACLSPFHFSRLFSETMGRSPHRYVTERRVEAAKEKLRLAHSSLVEIALDTGFGTQTNFNRVFKKITGQTPGQYRTFNAA
jgi:AraC family transcriptional regulator